MMGDANCCVRQLGELSVPCGWKQALSRFHELRGDPSRGPEEGQVADLRESPERVGDVLDAQFPAVLQATCGGG